MGEATVIILHPPAEGDGPLTSLLHEARDRLTDHHIARFVEAGAADVIVERGPRAATFGERLDEVAVCVSGGLVLLSAGSVPRLRTADARRLVTVARGEGPPALTNNRHSSDVIAVADTSLLRGLRDEPGDNALPRRLAERGLGIAELPGRERLAMDLDTPLDLAILCLIPGAPRPVRDLGAAAGMAVPRLAELRALAASQDAELLVAGRSSARTLVWLERRTACRVRFLAEERGLRTAPPDQRPPRTTIGRLLDVHGPGALATLVADLGDGAILDSRVLLADHFGRDERGWPSAEDRYASDLLRPAVIDDPWLRALTEAAAAAAAPILLGGHTVVGPGLPWLLGQRGRATLE